MNTEKGLSTLLGLLLVLAIAGGGAYLYKNGGVIRNELSIEDNLNVQDFNEGKEASDKKTESSDLISWNTFKSSTYDYEIKYPSSYELTWQSGSASANPPGIDTASYNDGNYIVSMQIFAREGSVLDQCVRDLSENNTMKTIDANGTKLYAYNDHEVGTGGRMALAEGGVRSGYQVVHDGQCYIIMYSIVPEDPTSLSESQMSDKVKLLDEIVSTFKFTK